MLATSSAIRGISLRPPYRIGDSLILQDSDLNSPVLCATGSSIVVSDGFRLAKSEGLDQTPQIQTVDANQILNDGLCPAFTQTAIFCGISSFVRKSDDF